MTAPHTCLHLFVPADRPERFAKPSSSRMLADAKVNKKDAEVAMGTARLLSL